MFATPVSAWLQRRGIHYGWIVAAITFLTMLTMSAALGLPGAMLQPLGKEFGWSTEQISSSLALRFALFGLMGPFAAVLMERYGLRAVVCTGLALVGLGMALVTMASQLWQLFVLWSLMLGLGTGMTALVLGAVVANRWFVARRGLVVGMLTASSATGQLAFLPLGQDADPQAKGSITGRLVGGCIERRTAISAERLLAAAAAFGDLEIDPGFSAQ